MIFLIEYDRPQGRITRFKVFPDAEQEGAEGIRLEIELELNRRRIEHDVILLQADSEEALRQTHRRYFEDAEKIASSTSE